MLDFTNLTFGEFVRLNPEVFSPVVERHLQKCSAEFDELQDRLDLAEDDLNECNDKLYAALELIILIDLFITKQTDREIQLAYESLKDKSDFCQIYGN